MNVSENEYTIRCKLGDILHERNLTQHALAALTGVKQGSISRIINGNERFHIEHLVRIADALDLTVPDLFEVKRTEKTR